VDRRSMAKLVIDNEEIECRDGIMVLQAALEAGWEVPHYCFHPGLSVVASCRLCLMEIKMPNPRTQELDWSPKLMPSCQTPVRDGMIVRFHSEKVRNNQRDCMEFFLLNHPLDCPVCDQAGECYLQDYSFKFGAAQSRMVDEKIKNPKKDVGPRTLLYQDRCVLCTRCVRFCDEISGTGELCVVNRGAHAEIDAFPGVPLDNPLQGNVVDICPVGALLDKDFLFKRRVWELRPTPSVCPGCATGCSIRVEHADDVVYRIKPRYNPDVNAWWICDEGRFGYKYIRDARRITRPAVRRGPERKAPKWEDVPRTIRFRIEEQVNDGNGETVFLVASPFMSCEETWLLVRFIREVAPGSVLSLGHVPAGDADQHFPVGSSAQNAKFTICREKAPNRRGVQRVLEAAGGTVEEFEDLAERAANGEFTVGWVVGGCPSDWVDKKIGRIAGKVDLLIVQDMFENALTEAAAILLPACAWAEREGSFMNRSGVVQHFDRAVSPPDGCRTDGQYLYETAGFEGLYRAQRVRELMAATMPEFAEVGLTRPSPAHAH